MARAPVIFVPRVVSRDEVTALADGPDPTGPSGCVTLWPPGTQRVHRHTGSLSRVSADTRWARPVRARRRLREKTIRSTFVLDSGNGGGQPGRRAWVTNGAGGQPRGRAGGAGMSGAMCAPNPAVIQVDPSSDTRRAS